MPFLNLPPEMCQSVLSNLVASPFSRANLLLTSREINANVYSTPIPDPIRLRLEFDPWFDLYSARILLQGQWRDITFDSMRHLLAHEPALRDNAHIDITINVLRSVPFSLDHGHGARPEQVIMHGLFAILSTRPSMLQSVELTLNNRSIHFRPTTDSRLPRMLHSMAMLPATIPIRMNGIPQVVQTQFDALARSRRHTLMEWLEFRREVQQVIVRLRRANPSTRRALMLQRNVDSLQQMRFDHRTGHELGAPLNVQSTVSNIRRYMEDAVRQELGVSRRVYCRLM